MMPGGAGSQYTLSMRPSKTMPQLRYTRDDIQEQYTATMSNQDAQHPQHQSSSASKRRQHNQQQGLSPQDSGEELTDSAAEADNMATNRGRSKQRKKRQRRSRSASFFSGCFALPNTIRSRSILSHLGFATNSAHTERRTSQTGPSIGRISESKTLGNLQQHSTQSPIMSNNGPSSGRKHVSFGSGRKGNQQHQSKDTAGEADGPKGLPAKQVDSPNVGPNSSNQDVIVNRGHQQAREQTQLAGPSKVPTSQAEAMANAGQVTTGQPQPIQPKQLQQQQQQHQHQPPQAPIYLVSQVPGAHRPTVLHQHPQPGGQFNYVSHQQQQPATIMPMQAIYHNQPMHQLQPLHGPVYVAPVALQPATTLYKRLPAAPMRTQATQTDITAYHLMATPSYGSASSSQAGSRPESCKRQQQNSANTNRDQQNTEATAASFSSSPCSKALKNEELSKQETTPEASCSKTMEQQPNQRQQQPKKPQPQQLQPQNRHKDDDSLKSGESPLLGLSSEAWSADNDEETAPASKGDSLAGERAANMSGGPENGDDDEDVHVDDNDDDNDCGNLHASTLASSSSRSSSTTSLVAHDSTLANTLVNYEPLEEPEHGQQRASIIISTATVGAIKLAPAPPQASGSRTKQEIEKAEAKLKFDNERELVARDGPKAPPPPPPQPNNRHQIDPPSQFKDAGKLVNASHCDRQQRSLALNDDEPLSLSEASSQTDPVLAQHIIDISQSMSRSLEDEAIAEEEADAEERRPESGRSTPMVLGGQIALPCDTQTAGHWGRQPVGAIPSADPNHHHERDQQNTNRPEGSHGDYRNECGLGVGAPNERADESVTMDDEFEPIAGRGNICDEPTAGRKSLSPEPGTLPESLAYTEAPPERANRPPRQQTEARDLAPQSICGATEPSPSCQSNTDESSLPMGAWGVRDLYEDEQHDQGGGEASKQTEEQEQANRKGEDIGGNKVFADPIPLAEPSLADAKEHWKEEEEEEQDEEKNKEIGAGPGGQPQPMEAPNGPDKVGPGSRTIRRLESDMAANAFMIASSHESSSSGDDQSEEQAQDIVMPEQGGSGRAPGSSNSSQDKPSDESHSTAVSAIRSLTTSSSASSSPRSSRASSGRTDSEAGVSATGSAQPVLQPEESGQRSPGPELEMELEPVLGGRSPSAGSPPTTVSELDQDEELSTPSFVDSYRNRLAQVCQFAGELAGQLIRESQEAAAAKVAAPAADSWQRTDSGPHRQEPLRHKPPTPSGSSSSSSSNNGGLSEDAQLVVQRAATGEEMEGNSSFSPASTVDSSLGSEGPPMVALAGKNDNPNAASSSDNSSLEDHPRVGSSRHAPPVQPNERPELPRKPAHLKLAAGARTKGQGGEEAAAAIAVTATSIAAAAVRHSARPGPLQVDVARPLEIAAPTSGADRLEVDDDPRPDCSALQTAEADETPASSSEKSNEPKAIIEQTGSRSGSVCSTNSVIDASERRRAQQSADPHHYHPGDALSVSSQVEEAAPTTSGTGASSRTGRPSPESSQVTLDSERSLSSSCELERVAQSEEDSVAQPMGAAVGLSSEQNKEKEDELSDSNEQSPARPQLTAGASQELSTVSEVSEEISQLNLHQHQHQHQQKSLADSPGARGLEVGAGGRLPTGADEQSSGGPAEASEHDLASGEHISRPWEPSSGANLAGADLSAAVSRQSGCGKPDEITAQQPPVVRAQPSREEQRRRSLGSSGSGTSASSMVCTTRTLAGSKSPAFDCPYVHDIIPLSPPPSQPSASVDGLQVRSLADQQEVALVPRSIQRRLSHDDTMEAIEDDIEGEEQELREQQQQQILDIEPPAAFGHQHPLSPPEPIREADNEDDDDDEEDEESSISVSQHGVIVSQEVGPSGARRTKQALTSMSNSTSSTSSEPTPSNSRPLAKDELGAENDEDAVRNKPQTEPSGPDEEDGRAADSSSGGAQQSKSNSSESATNAILDHLSRHHRELTLDEPAPQLEQSRSVDPQLRRESWRRESGSARHQTPTSEPKTPELANDRPANEKVDQLNTNTIRRGTKLAARSGSNEEASSVGQESASERPPLGSVDSGLQLGQHQQTARPQAQASLATDTSICSSCSCLETTEPTVDHEHTATTAAAAPMTAQAKEPVPGKGAAERSGETWMSQEEGTVFTENYWLSHWLYISEHEEAEIWRRAIDMSQVESHSSGASVAAGRQTEPDQSESRFVATGVSKEMAETESTGSERNFSSKYKSTTRKMIHRRATIEMYKRIANNNLNREKRVEISRSNGEFGFRIHGSRPVVVSAIERGTAAETCGLQVGDLIYAINGTNILDMAHSDVVRLAHSADSSSLVLDLVPTNDFLRMTKYSRAANELHEPTVTGYLMRLSPSTAQPLLIELQEQMSKTPGVSSQQRATKLTEVMRLAWRLRYFVLRSDNCLYWYRSPTDIEPYGGINLQGFSASLTNEFSEPNYVIRLIKYGGQPHYFGTNNVCDIQTWVDAINKAATEANQNDPYMKRTLTLARTRPSQITEPDCCGYLYKFSHKKSGGAHWRAAYFVLKDACLLLFKDQQAESVRQASAVYYLHGYRVRTKHIEHKRHTFELIPPNRKTIGPMFLMANSEIDKKRWIAALEYSIDRWIEID